MEFIDSLSKLFGLIRSLHTALLVLIDSFSEISDLLRSRLEMVACGSDEKQ